MTSVNAIYTWTNSFGAQFSDSSYANNGLNNQQTVINRGGTGDSYFPKLCTVTSSDGGLGWWMVDLGASFHITSIQIFGAPDLNVSGKNRFKLTFGLYLRKFL